MIEHTVDIETKQPTSGFSLIEISVALTVIGLLLVPLLHVYNIKQKQDRIYVTESNLRIIDSALSKYAVRTGRYPRPADRNLAPDVAMFGKEVGLVGNPACTGDDAVVCRVAGIRDTPADVDAANDNVLIGDVPFAEIGVPYKYIIDGFGNKITYAVSLNMTDPSLAPVDDSWGVLEVLDFNGAFHDGTAPSGFSTVHFVLVSHGENGEGAYSYGGVLVAGCSSSGVQDDNLNCDGGDASFLSNYDTTVSGVDILGAPIPSYQRQQMLSGGVQYYDDYLRYRTTVTGDIRTQNIGVSDIFNTNTGNIRIGSYPNNAQGSPDSKITVMDGDVASDTLYTNRLCHMDSSNPDDQCVSTPNNPSLVLPAVEPEIFSPAVIGGTVNSGNEGQAGGGIKCAQVTSTSSYEAMTGIRKSDEQCGISKFPNGYVYNPGCPPGEYPRRIVGGVVQCEIP